MMTKLLTVAAFFAAQLLITWYGYYMGTVPPRGSLFGFQYESPLISLLVIQLKFIWIPILINLLYGIGFQYGNDGFHSFLIVISLWIATAPVAAVVFNALKLGERIDLPIVLGLLLVVTGSLVTIAHKELAKLLP